MEGWRVLGIPAKEFSKENVTPHAELYFIFDGDGTGFYWLYYCINLDTREVVKAIARHSEEQGPPEDWKIGLFLSVPDKTEKEDWIQPSSASPVPLFPEQLNTSNYDANLTSAQIENLFNV